MHANLFVGSDVSAQLLVPTVQHSCLLTPNWAETAVYVVQVFDDKDDIDGINDAYWQLRAEAVPEDQLSVSEQDQLIQVCHFSCDQQTQVGYQHE